MGPFHTKALVTCHKVGPTSHQGMTKKNCREFPSCFAKGNAFKPRLPNRNGNKNNFAAHKSTNCPKFYMIFLPLIPLRCVFSFCRCRLLILSGLDAPSLLFKPNKKPREIREEAGAEGEDGYLRLI